MEKQVFALRHDRKLSQEGLARAARVCRQAIFTPRG